MDELSAAKLYATILNKKHPTIVVTVTDGVSTNISDNVVIPNPHIMGQKASKDGLFIATEATCGGGCSIGQPAQKCVRDRIYSPRKCSVYSFTKYSSESTLHTEIQYIVEAFEEMQKEHVQVVDIT